MERNFDIGVTFSWSPLLLFLFVLLAVGFTLWVYRRTIPPVSGSFRFVLIALRSGAFILMCLVIFGPVLQITGEKTKKATVGLLIDTSSSMQIPERGKMRKEMLQQVLSSSEMETLKDRYILRYYFFSDSMIPIEEFLPDSIPFDGTATDIARALKNLREQKRETPLGGVLLLSDGAHNLGEDPVRVGESLGCPIYTVSIGETVQKPDLILSQILTNEITYVGDRVPVEVSVRGSGFGGKRVSVRLRTGEEILDQREVTIPPDGLEISLRLHFTPQNSGYQKITSEISRLEGELTFENNLREFIVKVLKSKLNVLLVADAPSPDLAFLKRILLTDENLHLIARTQKRGAGFYEGPFPPEAEMEKVDLFVLLDVPSQSTSPAIWDRVTRIIHEQRTPFFLIAGKRVDFQRLKTVEALLPFYFPEKIAEGFVLPRLTPEGEIHPVLRIFENVDENQTAWHQLPPLFSRWKSSGPKPGCQLLATGVPEKVAYPSTPEGFPLILARHVGEEKSVVLLGHGLFRWDLLMWGVGGTNEVLKGFLGNTVRWLATREEDKPVRISANKRIYRSGEEVYLSAQVYDETYRPVEKVLVKIVLASPSGESTFQLTDAGEGRYKGTFRVFEAGDYRVSGEATLYGRSLGRDETEFSVSSHNPEFFDTRANPELMASLAQATGGKSGPPDSLAAIVQAMSFPSHTVLSKREIELYSLPWMLALIVLMLSTEWFVRKRKGMV